MSEIEESAKAVQEVAKATSNAIDKTSELSRFISRIVGPAIQDLGDIVRQYTEHWKIRNALHLRDKLERILAERGNPDITSLPLRIGIPLLDAALAEDDDNLQNLWANLLASAMTEADRTHSAKSFVEVLKQVDVADAELLNILYLLHLRGMAKPEETTYVNDSGKYDIIQISVALNNLERLGLLKICKDEDISGADEVRISLWFSQQDNRRFKAQIELTLFGIHFMRICTDRKMILSDGSEILPIEDRFYYPTPSEKS
jgi:hypothetical protein